MATYKFDAAHSEVTFKVRHLMISNVTGSFSKFDSTLTADKEDFTDAKVTFEADTNSISTNNEQRDGHLKADDFFSVEKFPKLTFDSTSIAKTNDEDYTLTGNLTIRDVTKPVTLDVIYNGSMIDPWFFDAIATNADIDIIYKKIYLHEQTLKYNKHLN